MWTKCAVCKANSLQSIGGEVWKWSLGSYYCFVVMMNDDVLYLYLGSNRRQTMSRQLTIWTPWSRKPGLESSFRLYAWVLRVLKSQLVLSIIWPYLLGNEIYTLVKDKSRHRQSPHWRGGESTGLSTEIQSLGPKASDLESQIRECDSLLFRWSSMASWEKAKACTSI